MNKIIKYWIRALPFSVGFLLTIASVYFMNHCISRINISYPYLYFEGAAYLGTALFCGLIGIPLCAYGIKLLDEKDI